MATQHDLTSLQPLDRDVQGLCTYDFTPAERADAAGPGHAASVCVTSIAIAGHDLDAGNFHPTVVAALEAAILAEKLEEIRFEQEYEDMSLAEAA